MDFEQLKKTAEQNGAQFNCVDGVPHSVNPPETLFGFTYWSHCIPPVSPENCLILGSKGGTLIALIDMVYPNTTFTGVDSKAWECVSVVKDALDFVQDCKDTFDCVIVDLWNGSKISPHVDSEYFIENLAKVCSGYLCINYSPRKDYGSVHCEKYGEYFSPCRADVVFDNVVEWWVKK